MTMRKEIILPALALAGGFAGLGLRCWERATAFEAETGLPIPGMPATWAMIGFTVLLLAALALLCRGKHNALGGYDQAFTAKGNTLYLFFMIAAAGLALLSCVMACLELPELYAVSQAQAQRHGNNASMLTLAPRVLLTVACAVLAYSLFRLGRHNYRGEGKGKYNAFLLIPCYAACLWLAVAYQAKSGDPVILDYVWQLLAIIAIVLGTYFTVGFAFERAKVYPASFFSLAAIYFILVTLPDGHTPSTLLLYGAFLLYLFASSVALLFNARRPMLRRMPDSGRTEEGEAPELGDIILEETNDE